MDEQTLLRTNGLKKIYLSQPSDVDSEAVVSKFRVQREWHREKLNSVFRHLNLENKDVLDLACGSGGLTRKLKRKCPSANIFGVDFNEEAINYANEVDEGITGLRYKSGDAQDLTFKKNSFDVVIGLDMLDHIPDYNLCLSEIHRVLRPGGKLILTVENRRSLWPIVEYIWDRSGGRDYGNVHVVHFTPKSFRNVLVRAGFSINKFYTIHNINTFFYLLSDYYPKKLNSYISRKRLGLTLFCYAEKH